MVPFSFRGMWVGGDKVPNWENDIFLFFFILWAISRIKAGHVAKTNFKEGGFMGGGGRCDRTLPKIKYKGQLKL